MGRVTLQEFRLADLHTMSATARYGSETFRVQSLPDSCHRRLQYIFILLTVSNAKLMPTMAEQSGSRGFVHHCEERGNPVITRNAVNPVIARNAVNPVIASAARQSPDCGHDPVRLPRCARNDRRAAFAMTGALRQKAALTCVNVPSGAGDPAARAPSVQASMPSCQRSALWRRARLDSRSTTGLS
jgi:hypothetical protein